MAAKVTQALQKFKTLKVGAGGWMTGHSQHADGTLVARTDVYGAYIWNENSKTWSQIVTTATMPAADHRQDNAAGVFEITLAPSNSSHVWMAYNGRVYRSLDRAKSFTLTSFPQQTDMDSNDQNARLICRKMAVDPHDSNHVLAGAGKEGLWQTYDGGESWARVDSVAMPSFKEGEASLGVGGIIFDPQSQGRIFVSSQNHGVFLSDDGGKSFHHLKGGPVTVLNDCDIALDGMLYGVEYGGKRLWRYDGAWLELTSDITSQEAMLVTCDPASASRIVFATAGGSVVMSEDRGMTISGINWHADTFGKADIAWQQILDGGWLGPGNLTYDKQGSGELLMSMGIGFLRGKISGAPHAISVHWTYMAAGVEELVANQVIATPNGNIGVASWDRAYFRIENADVYPDHYEGNWGEVIVHCTGVDWCAQDPNVIAMVNFSLGSGVSRDGGRSFTRFASSPFADFPQGGGGGEIAVGGPDNYVWAPTNKMQPQWTKDGGQSWSPITLPGVANDSDGLSGINWAYYFKRHILAADRVAHGTFYLWHAMNGVFVSRDGGEKWSAVYGGELLAHGGYNAKMRTVPGHEGHLFASAGPQAGDDATGDFRWSVNGGKTWSSIEGVLEVSDFGFGAVAPGQSYSAIWIVGYVNGDFGIFRSEDKCASWIKVSAYPLGSIDTVVAIDGDKKIHDRCYIGFQGSGYAYAPGGLKKAEIPGPTKPGYMMVPAAVAARFARRWSRLKTEHQAMEREIEAALGDASVSAESRAAVKKMLGE
jgi:hypothetical protein